MPRSERVVTPRSVTCTECGWVSYAVTRAEAESEVARINAHLATLSPEYRRYWAPEGSTLASYVCLKCGGSDFRPARTGDCPNGVTFNPVVWEGDP